MMKKALIFIFLLPFGLVAQPFIRCYTSETDKQLKQLHPELIQRESEVSSLVNEWLSKNPGKPGQDNTNSIITIPVVVHIVFNLTSDSISDAVVNSQISVLNKDYSRTNSDSSQTPPIFRIVAGNPQIQFCLAQRTPDNKGTNGIERRHTPVSDFSNMDDVKYYSLGGLDAWDPNLYLNLWVCDLPDLKLGFATMPSAAGFSNDGVVVDFSAFGTTGTLLNSKYNKGRTSTHEVGHWLGLYHIWGDDGGGCTGSDSIADTPNQADNTYGCPTYPKTNDACTPGFPGIMFMNYMDYTDDACMNMFSFDQGKRMTGVLSTVRSSLLSSPGCISVGIEETDLNKSLQIFPNPAKDQFTVSGLQFTIGTTFEINNMLGEIVYSDKLQTENSKLQTIPVSSLSPGIYQLVIRTKSGMASRKISVVR